jgi:hypothetical protein
MSSVESLSLPLPLLLPVAATRDGSGDSAPGTPPEGRRSGGPNAAAAAAGVADGTGTPVMAATKAAGARGVADPNADTSCSCPGFPVKAAADVAAAGARRAFAKPTASSTAKIRARTVGAPADSTHDRGTATVSGSWASVAAAVAAAAAAAAADAVAARGMAAPAGAAAADNRGSAEGAAVRG